MNKNEIINSCTIQGNIIKLPAVQIDRRLFLEVKSEIGLIGGKWEAGKVQGFVFTSDPAPLLSTIKNK